jgi:hypothetical protein
MASHLVLINICYYGKIISPARRLICIVTEGVRLGRLAVFNYSSALCASQPPSNLT